MNSLRLALGTASSDVLLQALKRVADAEILPKLARLNSESLVDGRMDSDDLEAIANEVQLIRNTNRILLGLQADIIDLTKDIINE